MLATQTSCMGHWGLVSVRRLSSEITERLSYSEEWGISAAGEKRVNVDVLSITRD